MTDISKCMGHDCGQKLLCHRYTAPWHQYRQSFADFKPDPETGKCVGYWANAVAGGDVSKNVNHNED